MDIQRQKQLKVLLAGDSCKDIYHYGACERLSPEAPVPVLKLQYTEIKPGMVLNVKRNLESFSVDVDVLTNEQMITKERFVDIKTKNHLLRFDTGEQAPLSLIKIKTVKNVDFSKYDAVALVDYNKGTLNKENISIISRECKKNNIPLFVDSKKKDLSAFNNYILKINNKEEAAVERFPEKYEMIVTHGSKGAIYQDKIYKALPVEVYDVCGAGDTFFSALVYKFLIEKNLEGAIKFANKCARITVSRSGVYAPSKEDLLNL